MTDHNTDEIRDLLARAMSDAPEPRAWADVERRARQHDAPPHPRRTGVWLAVAACTIALLGGLVAVISFGDEPEVRIDAPDDTTPSTSTIVSTSVPAPTTNPVTTTAPAPGVEAGWTGGLLDDVDVDSLRPLDSLAEGGVVVPTGPSGWRVSDAAWTNPDDAVAPEFVEWSVEVFDATNNGFGGQVLYLTQSREPICRTTLGCQPSGESVTINGVVWEVIVVERIPEDDPEFVDATTLRARVGDRWVALAAGADQLLTGPLLENPPIIEFIEGLRISSPENLAELGEACWQCGAAGAEGDPFAATESPTAAPTTMPDGAQTPTSEPGAPASSDIGSDTGRPLTDLAEGDVIVPTYIPPGLILQDTARIHEYPGGDTEFSISLESADEARHNAVRLWDYGNDVGPLDPNAVNDPNHPPVEIAGLTWGWGDFEPARITNIGPFSVWVYLDGLDRSQAQRFIEGLRAVPVEQFPNPIVSDGADGLSVIDGNNTVGAEIVAADDEFELTAIQVADRMCARSQKTTVRGTFGYFAECWESERLANLRVVKFFPVDGEDFVDNTAVEYLLIGFLHSSSATSVRITSPDGASIVVPTGPANQAIDGRFFIARLVLDVSNGISVGQITFEDASP